MSSSAALNEKVNEDAVRPGQQTAGLEATTLRSLYQGRLIRRTMEIQKKHKQTLGLARVNLPKRARQMDEFNKEVGVYIRTDRLPIDPQRAAAVQELGDEIRTINKELLEAQQNAGVKGSLDVTDNPNYLSRVWSERAVQDLIDEKGYDKAFREMRSDIPLCPPAATGQAPRAAQGSWGRRVTQSPR